MIPALLFLALAGVAVVTGWDDTTVSYLVACALVFAIVDRRRA